MNFEDPFSFRWSRKRNRNSQELPAVASDDNAKEITQPKIETMEMQSIQEAMLQHLSIQDTNQSHSSDEGPIVAVKKFKKDENKMNSPSIMDVDNSSSGDMIQDQRTTFDEELSQMQNLETKYQTWLSGQWIPTKENALQLLADAKALQQHFRALFHGSTTVNTEGETLILKMCDALTDRIKASITECEIKHLNTCSFEFMDYEYSSIGKRVMKKQESERESRPNLLETSNQDNTFEGQRNETREESDCLNSANATGSNESDVTEFSENILNEDFIRQNPQLRSTMVKALRAQLLPKIFDMLDNFEEWIEGNLKNTTMWDFLESK